MNFLDAVLSLAGRGFRVFPLIPREKRPLLPGGYKNGTTDLDQLRLWWTRTPQANVGIACGESDIGVMDCDHGLTCYEDFIAWRDRNGLPPTYTVRSGRRFKADGTPEYGVQMYFRGAFSTQGRKTWKLDGCAGDFKSTGGLVVAPPSIHPDSGEAYEILLDVPIVDRPAFILGLPTVEEQKAATLGTGDELIDGNRNDEMVSFVGRIRKQIAGLDQLQCLYLCQLRNERYLKGPMSEEEVAEIVSKQYRLYPDVAPDPVAVLGSQEEKPAPVDWRTHYHTTEAHDSVGPPEFLIDSFLQRKAIMALGAYVGQKKTLLALNIVRSLCSGEPLFGRFEVTRKPSRVLYLGPENGLISFSNRVNSIGLRPYLGETFFYTTMSMEKLPLLQLTPEEIQGAVIFIDTAIRYTDGSENDAGQMKAFSETVFSLIRYGAESVVVLHHSPKAMTKAGELSLDNAFRGSGELTAFLSVALALRTQDMNDEYGSASLIRFVKQRDFEPQPASFEVTTDRNTCQMTYVDGSNGASVLKNPGNADGRKAEALQVVRDNPTLSLSAVVLKLAERGIKRSRSWVGLQRNEITGTGVTWTEG